MPIEQTLERIAESLNQIAMVMTHGAASVREASSQAVPTGVLPSPAAVTEKKPKATKKSEAPAVVEAPVKAITTEDVAAELRIFVGKNGKDKAVELLKKYNAVRISEVKPEDFGKLVNDMKAASANG